MISWDGPPALAQTPTRLHDRLLAAALVQDHDHDWEWAKVRLDPDGTSAHVEWSSRWTLARWFAIAFVLGTEVGALLALLARR